MNAEAILQESWTLFRRNWRYLSVVAAINFVISLALSFSAAFLGATSLIGFIAGSSRYNAALMSVLAVLLLLLILAAFIAPILTGASAFAAKHVLKKTTDDPLVPYKEALASYSTFLPVLSVVGLALFFGTILFVLPGIVVLVAFFCTTYILVTEGGTLIEVLSRSATIGKLHAGTILLLVLVIGIVSFVSGLLVSHLPFVGPFLAGYVQSIIGMWSMLVVAVFYTKATAK